MTRQMEYPTTNGYVKWKPLMWFISVIITIFSGFCLFIGNSLSNGITEAKVESVDRDNTIIKNFTDSFNKLEKRIDENSKETNKELIKLNTSISAIGAILGERREAFNLRYD